MKTNPVLRSSLTLSLLILTLQIRAADLVWIGGTGNWNAAGNWSPAQIPTISDNVWITNNGTYTVTIPAGTSATNNNLTVGGGNGTQTVAIDRATLTLNGPSVVNANGEISWLVSQSVLTGPGSLTVSGTLNWANGTMSGGGATIINSGAVLAIGSGGVTLGRTLNNSGIATWAGGNFTISAGNSLNNQSGGRLDITADGRLSGGSTTPINNAGSFRQTGGSAGTVITAPLNNSGTLQVEAASLSLNLGGNHSGVFSNAPGGTLNLGGGAHALGSSSQVLGSGVVTLTGAATLTASGIFGLGSTLTVSSGIATLTSASDVTGASVNVAGGGATVLFNSTGTVGTMGLSAGTLGGTSPVRVTGLLTLSGGTITNGLVFADGGLAISGNTTLNGAKLVNPGTAIWSAGNITGANGAAISNLVGATFVNNFDGNIGTGGGTIPVFVNAGAFAKTNGTAAAGTTSIDFQFLNTGTVEVRTNTLRYSVNQQTAGLTLLNGGGLTAQAQPLQFAGGSLMGTGLVTVANAQNVVNSASVSPGLPIGELDIAGNYQQTAAGALNIDLGGYVAGTEYDLVTVAAGGGGGAATLGGALNVALVNGFSPTNGATFTFLTASSRAGAFAIFNYPSNDIGMQVNYGVNSAAVRVTNLKPVVLNPIADPPPITYGDPVTLQFAADTFVDPDGDALTYTASGLPVGVSFNPETRTFTGVAGQAGVFPITLTATDSGTPSLSVTTDFTLTIGPALLGVVAHSQSKIYGAADPELTYTVSGLLLGDTAVEVLSGALARNPGESVAGNPYSITQGTLAAGSNYLMSFIGSSLTITPAPLSVTADPKSKVYGNADPAFTASYSGLVNGETATVLNGSLAFSRAPGENAGAYAITPAGLTSPNYTIRFNPGILTITKAPLTVTAENKSKTYGSVDPTFTAGYAGFVTGDTSANLAGTLNFNRAVGENVGTYAVTPAGLTSGNYDISFNPGTLSVTPASLDITAENKTKTYGAPDPIFTATYSGFVFSDDVSVLGGTLTFNRSSGENAGTYTILPSGLSNANYTIRFRPGTLTVAPAGLTVTADSKTKVYGTADPVFTASFGGFVNGDNAVALGGTLLFARSPGENVGTYSISASGLTSSNYTISFVSGSLTITAAQLVVTAENKTKTYGAADPVFTALYAGLVNGDSTSALSGTLTLARTPGESVGDYTITPAGLTSLNYTITFNAGTLSIQRAPLTVNADAKSKVYGNVDPVFTVSYSGFVNGETPAVLGGSLTIVRTTGESVGTYTITPSGLTSSNYSIGFVAGTLTITAPAPAILSLTRSGPREVTVAWSAVSNATYRVQFVTEVGSTNWTDLAGDITATSSMALKSDALTAANRFYRIRLLP